MYQLNLGKLTVAIILETTPPFEADGVVYEQDTALILGKSTVFREPLESTEELLQQALNRTPLPLGSVLVKGQHPFKLLAIIHDVEQIPICTEKSIKQAWQNLFQKSEELKLHSLASPLLGTVFGHLNSEQAVTLFRSEVIDLAPTTLNMLFILVPDCTEATTVFKLLNQAKFDADLIGRHSRFA